MPLDDVLYGAAEIGRALGLPRRTVYHHAAAGRLPTFKLGATLCARRSAVTDWLAAREASRLPGQGAGERSQGVRHD